MNLINQEQILIKDIFNVRVTYMQGDSDSVYLLKDFPNQIKNLGNKVSLVQHNTYFDSLLMERLQAPATQILGYLQDSLMRAQNARQKPWNQEPSSQKFIQYSIEIIKNFTYLSLADPEIFPDQLQIDLNASKAPSKIQQIVMKILTHFERRNYINMSLIDIMYPKIIGDVDGDFVQSFLQTLTARQRFQTILDPKSFFYLSILQSICSIPVFRIKFFNLQKQPFIPKQLKSITGSMLDIQSPFGIFTRCSILGSLSGYFHQQLEANQRFEERMMKQFGKEKFARDRLKYYSTLQNQLYAKLTDAFKVFLKKETQKPFLEWIHACVIGNLGKTKLGSKLQNSNNSNLSHDGFLVNIYVCMLNLSKVILNKNQDKYQNINPQYFIFNPYTNLYKFEQMKKKQLKNQKMNIEKQWGTITEFFFLSLELIYVGLIPAQQNFIQCYQLKEKIQKQKAKIPQNHPMYKKIQFQLQKVQSKLIRYYILLLDDGLISTTAKLFDMVLFLLPKWLGFSYESLEGGKLLNYKPTQLIYYIPEHLISSIYKFHLTNFKFKPHYLQTVPEDHINQMINLTCLILSEAQIVSNPYIGADFIQLIFFLLHENKTGTMYQVFKGNTVGHRNLSINLVRFYCDIAVTGSSHQFYSKFKYRFYVNKIFTSLWQHEVYREDLKKYFTTDIYERFINMIMTDLTYCFDEANQKYSSYKDLERKKSQGPLTPEDQRNQQQISNVMSASLQQSTSNLKLMRDLSRWSPQTFLSDASLSTIVPLLNNILHTFIEPTCFVSNRQLITKYRFDKELVFSDLIQIYCNLDIDDKTASQIVKDTRFYEKQSFTKALQKASNEHYTDIATLEQFQQLIRKLGKAVNEEQDQQIFGEIPEKYLCSLMSTLLKDPVELPTSGKIVDRVYIHKHLLNDERDPFTRAPLKYNEVKEMKDLKMEIQNWKKIRLQQLKGANKEVKYGKINVNKKQQQDENLFNDKILDIEDEQP